jgi:CheY-like chemotaxis protein
MDLTASSTSGRQALLVEDEALVAMIAEDYLRDLGLEPLTARSAAEALRLLDESDGVAVALIDVGLPDQRGDELAKHLRIVRPELPILMASGYDHQELLGRFGGDPQVGALSKPYTESELTAALGALGVSLNQL